MIACMIIITYINVKKSRKKNLLTTIFINVLVNQYMSMEDNTTGFSNPKLKQVVMVIDLPDCHPQTKSKIIHQLTKRQLKQVRCLFGFASYFLVSIR